MKERIFYSAGSTDALAHAAAILKEKGCRFADTFDSTVTHLLLDVPHKNWDGLPAVLSPDLTVMGGNLSCPALTGCKTIDLLQDPLYLAENANITAHCAVKLALDRSPVILYGCPVLVVGWGRIGKCLAQLLRQMGARVTVAVRKETDRAMLLALGYDVIDTQTLTHGPAHCRMIFNTVPSVVLTRDALSECPKDCLKLELASLPGMEGDDIINARGLPNRGAPESSGQLIARSILRLG